MERFQYKWEYRKGSENVADALSRNPALADPPIIAPITALGSIKHVKTLPICILPNKDAYVLFVQERNGKWSWPAGRIENYDNSPAEAATRETLEESALFVDKTNWSLIGYETHPSHGSAAVYTYTHPFRSSRHRQTSTH